MGTLLLFKLLQDAKVSKRDKPLEFLRFDPKNQAHMHWIRFV